jgi:hypothetical protein
MGERTHLACCFRHPAESVSSARPAKAGRSLRRPDQVQVKCRVAQWPQCEREKRDLAIIACYAIGAERGASGATVNDCPFAARTDLDANWLHRRAAWGGSVARFVVDMAGPEAAGTMVAMLRAGRISSDSP